MNKKPLLSYAGTRTLFNTLEETVRNVADSVTQQLTIKLRKTYDDQCR